MFAGLHNQSTLLTMLEVTLQFHSASQLTCRWNIRWFSSTKGGTICINRGWLGFLKSSDKNSRTLPFFPSSMFIARYGRMTQLGDQAFCAIHTGIVVSPFYSSFHIWILNLVYNTYITYQLTVPNILKIHWHYLQCSLNYKAIIFTIYFLVNYVRITLVGVPKSSTMTSKTAPSFVLKGKLNNFSHLL